MVVTLNWEVGLDMKFQKIKSYKSNFSSEGTGLNLVPK